MVGIVEEYKIGNTQIKIFSDAYMNRTQNDIDRSLARLADIARKAERGAKAS